MSGGLISASEGRKCQVYDRNTPLYEKYGYLEENSSYEEYATLKGIHEIPSKDEWENRLERQVNIPPILSQVLPPVKGVEFTRDFGTRHLSSDYEITEFVVCTWGNTIRGSTIGLPGEITETSCVFSTKEVSYDDVDVAKRVNSYWFLHDYGIFIEEAKDNERNFFKKDKNGNGSSDWIRTYFSNYGVEVVD